MTELLQQNIGPLVLTLSVVVVAMSIWAAHRIAPLIVEGAPREFAEYFTPQGERQTISLMLITSIIMMAILLALVVAVRVLGWSPLH